MAFLLIGSVLLGAILGRFFKVWILVPACALVLAAVIVRSVTIEDGLLRSLLEFVVLNATLQIGYAAGMLYFFILSVPKRRGKSTRSHPLLRQ